ncbi:MAG: crossover junction endodeoxyribonuclease RuvC [Verrucomicrobiae bacterium]|nr:crossover junction endodeoxyribonuclease RuvC [Verrucomicrobiae bacterium]
MSSSQVILGIDPSLRSTGYGVIESFSPSRHRVLTWGIIKNSPQLSVENCLANLYEKLQSLIHDYHPHGVALERTIYVQSHSVAITLGCARGVVLLAVAQNGLELFEYAPRQIKMASTGRGAARKNQVAFMIRALLGLDTTPSPDASDALAVALTHAQRCRYA